MTEQKEAPRQAKADKSAEPEQVPGVTHSPEGIPYQAPSRPFEDMDRQGQAPPYDHEVEREAALDEQRELERARYSK